MLVISCGLQVHHVLELARECSGLRRQWLVFVHEDKHAHFSETNMLEQTKPCATVEGTSHLPIEKLILRLRPFIEGRVRRRLQRHAVTRNRARTEDIEDLVQDVFVQLIARDGRALRKHDPRRMDLLSWVHLIADRLISSTLRSRQRNPWWLEPVDDQTLERYLDPVEPVDVKTDPRVAREVWLRAGPQARGVLQSLIDGYEIDEIPSLTGMTPSAVHQACRRLRKIAMSVAEHDAEVSGL